MSKKRRAKRRSPPTAGVRIRVKHVEEVEASKVALAIWLLAERMVRDKQTQAKQQGRTAPSSPGRPTSRGD